jgi:hypothetical protein
MYTAIVLTYLVAARVEPLPWLRPPPRRSRARAALGSLLVAIDRALRREQARRAAPEDSELVDPAASREL